MWIALEEEGEAPCVSTSGDTRDDMTWNLLKLQLLNGCKQIIAKRRRQSVGFRDCHRIIDRVTTLVLRE